MNRRAFTLIELLIVVAIIAILAAIAVPNFLEAQTRSKVSRAEADMRSLATAVESYAVDHNHYPPSQNGTPRYFLTFAERLVRLTTPVAYMTSIPKDPFPDLSNNDNPLRTFDYLCEEDTATVLPQVWQSFPGHEGAESAKWRLQSLGPDLEESLQSSPDPVQYDPTNGTVSFGDIHRYGP
ncbi:prepilin-type N-terminal cleavage/methylation domain-containing protein [bacterium]|nr:prepilin-type N-terminal cleavage/methylation domain-containing protein [bacterium]